MALGLEPPHRDEERTGKVRQGSEGDYRPARRNGAMVLAHGALICPGCNAPIAADRRLAVVEPISCGYCDTTAPARDFVVADVIDTVANEIYVLARL